MPLLSPGAWGHHHTTSVSCMCQGNSDLPPRGCSCERGPHQECLVDLLEPCAVSSVDTTVLPCLHSYSCCLFSKWTGQDPASQHSAEYTGCPPRGLASVTGPGTVLLSEPPHSSESSSLAPLPSSHHPSHFANALAQWRGPGPSAWRSLPLLAYYGGDMPQQPPL